MKQQPSSILESSPEPVSPPMIVDSIDVIDGYAQPQKQTILPVNVTSSPLYAQVHKEPRAEIQKIHSTIPNTFKASGPIDSAPLMTTFLGGKVSSANTPTTPSNSSSSSTARTQILAASYSNDLNSSYDSILGSSDKLSDSGNHSDSWMYPSRRKTSGGAGGGNARLPANTFTEQLNQVLADRERLVGFF